MLQGQSEYHLGAVMAIDIEIGQGPCLVHFGYRGCFEDHQKVYSEDHKCTVMATRVGLNNND